MAGTPVTLTATATVSGAKTPHEADLVKHELKYKYEAQRTWPCAETIPISGNGSSTTWTPPTTKAGEYKLVVTVAHPPKISFLEPLRVKPVTASIPYQVNQLGGLGYITVNATPTSTPITSASVSASVPPPAGGPYSYRFRLYCAASAGSSAHCTNGPYAAVQGDQNSASWPNIAITGTGQIRFDVNVDVINKSTCSVNSGFAYSFFNVQ